MLGRLNHVAIAVRNVEEAAKNFEKLGLELSKVEEVADQHALVAFFDVGSAHLELTAPMGEGALQRSIEKRGEGLHHLSIEAPDFDGLIARLEQGGVRIVDRFEAGPNEKTAFISPRSALIGLYALCGFANFASVGIQVGGISTLAPSRRHDLSRIGLLAMVGGTIASFMGACVVGVLI